MKTIFKLPLIIFLGFILSSCEDVVQVQLDQGSQLYVIDAFINDLNEPQYVYVTESADYFSNVAAPPVNNAIVTLNDLTANKLYNFNFTTNGQYALVKAANDTIALVGHQYQLNVAINGVVYTALATQKRTAGIDSISAIYDPDDSGFGTPAPFYYCFLWAKDRADGNPDYYWIKTFRNDTLFGASSDLNTSIDGTNGVVYENVGDSLDFTPPGIYLGFNKFSLNDACKVEIHSLTSEAYNFLNQAVTQIQNGGLFALTPENVRTNIVTPAGAATKAVGWFNMATVATKTKIVK